MKFISDWGNGEQEFGEVWGTITAVWENGAVQGYRDCIQYFKLLMELDFI